MRHEETLVHEVTYIGQIGRAVPFECRQKWAGLLIQCDLWTVILLYDLQFSQNESTDIKNNLQVPGTCHASST